MLEMTNATELSTRSLLRAGAPALVGAVVLVAAIVWLYMLVPVPTSDESPLAVGISIAMIALIYIAVGIWAMLRVHRSARPLRTGVLALSVMVTAMVTTFAMAYATMSATNPANFNVPLDKVSALYFTMTILSTTGFGDITATSDAGMIAVMVQMVVGLTLLTALARVLVAAARSGAKRRLTENTQA